MTRDVSRHPPLSDRQARTAAQLADALHRQGIDLSLAFREIPPD